MANETPPPLRARRWTPPPGASRRSSPFKSYRFAFRLIGIPAIAVAGVFLYRGISDRLALPECDSGRAKKTLAEVLKEMKLEPVHYEPIKTVSTTKDQVVCSAVLPLPDGATVAIDYKFYWQGSDADMKYSIVRKAPENAATPPASPTVTPPLR